jgi:hypothetical protein
VTPAVKVVNDAIVACIQTAESDDVLSDLEMLLIDTFILLHSTELPIELVAKSAISKRIEEHRGAKS